MARTDPNTVAVLVGLHKDLLAAVDEWGYRQRIRTRADTVRALLKLGLEAGEKKDFTTAKIGDQDVAGANTVVSPTGEVLSYFKL